MFPLPAGFLPAWLLVPCFTCHGSFELGKYDSMSVLGAWLSEIQLYTLSEFSSESGPTPQQVNGYLNNHNIIVLCPYSALIGD